MNLAEKRRAEKFIRERFDRNQPKSMRDLPTVKPSAALVKKVEALHTELVAAGFSVSFYGKKPEITPRNDHPAYVKSRDEEATRKNANNERRDALIHGVWAGTVEWPEVMKALG